MMAREPMREIACKGGKLRGHIRIAWTSRTLADDPREPTQPRCRRVVSLRHDTRTACESNSTSTNMSFSASAPSLHEVVALTSSSAAACHAYQKGI